MAAWVTGWFFMQRGTTLRIDLTWPRGAYPGLQFVMARLWTATTLARYEVTTESRGMSYQLVKVPYPPFLPYVPKEQYRDKWAYHIDVRNTSGESLYCTVTGNQVG